MGFAEICFSHVKGNQILGIKHSYTIERNPFPKDLSNILIFDFDPNFFKFLVDLYLKFSTFFLKISRFLRGCNFFARCWNHMP